MLKTSFTSLFAATCLTFSIAACSGDPATDSTGDDSGTGSGTGGEAGSTGSDTGTTDGTTDGGFVPNDESTTGTTTSTPPGPNGAMCSTDAECESMICVDVAGFTGLCSECATDQDCVDLGLGVNCSIGAAGFACGDGGLGQMCMSDDACNGDLVCAQIIDLGGLFNDQFCSECATDSECANGDLCTPTFVLDLANPAGQRECMAPGSVLHSGLCDVGNDTQCSTGICEPVSIMGFINVGICGDCDGNNPCAAGTCIGGSVDVAGGGGLLGSTCG